MLRSARPVAILLATTALAVGLAGCKPDRGASPPVVSGAPPLGPLDPAAVPAAYAPAAGSALEPAAQAYAYPQRAYAMSRVVHQRPPSYAFGYGDEQPYVWDDGDQGEMFAEPVSDGYRYYYYEPGEDYPYFVQDPDYGYAYGPNGALVALFGVTGALIAADHWRDHAPRAHDYWSRGYDLDRAYRHSTRYPVQPAIWRARAPALYSGHDRWFQAAQAQPAWRQAAFASAPGHDNGRHLGWFKDRGEGGPRHERAIAAPPAWRDAPQQVRIENGQSRNDHAWRQARQVREPSAAVAQAGHGPARPEHAAQGWRDAHAVGEFQPRSQHGRQHGGPAGGQDFARIAEPRGGAGWRGGGQHEGGGHGPGGGGNPGGGHPGGGQAFARSAEGHGGGGGGFRGGGGPQPQHGPPAGGGQHEGPAPGGGHPGGGDKGGGNHDGGHGHDH